MKKKQKMDLHTSVMTIARFILVADENEGLQSACRLADCDGRDFF